MKREEGFERTDSMLEGLGAGWTASFLAKIYPKVSHYLIKEFLQAVVEVSIVRDVWSRMFREGTGDTAHQRSSEPAVRWACNIDCDYPRKLGRTNKTNALSRADERECEEIRHEEATDSWNKIRDLRHTLIQYLLQQNRFGTGEDETIEREEDVRRH